MPKMKCIVLAMMLLVVSFGAAAQSLRTTKTMSDTIRVSMCDTLPAVVDTLVFDAVGTYVYAINDTTDVVFVVDQQHRDTTYLYDTICSNAPYALGDTVYATSGTYQTILATVHGCDSLVVLDLWVHPAYDNRYYDTLCDGQKIFFHDTSIADKGEYVFVDSTAYGCDSVSRLNVMVYPTYHNDTIFDTICSGVQYAFGDTVYTVSGEYGYEGLTAHGCDTTAALSLWVLANSDTTIYDTIFEKDLPWAFLDTVFTDSVTNGELHTTNAVGCDSVIHYNLFVWWDPDHCEQLIQFPNLVTPNGDGINDIFEIKGLLENECYTTNYLAIYDRWGHRVYYVENLSSRDEFWDPGKDRIPTGTYFFRFWGRGHDIFVNRMGCIEVLNKK